MFFLFANKQEQSWLAKSNEPSEEVREEEMRAMMQCSQEEVKCTSGIMRMEKSGSMRNKSGN